MIKILFNAQNYFDTMNSESEDSIYDVMPLIDSSHGVEIERIEKTQSNQLSTENTGEFDLYLANGLRVLAASSKDITVVDSATNVSLG